MSSIFWLSHSDLHEDRVTAVLEYMSSMVASIEPLNATGQRYDRENLSLTEHNCWKGKLLVRLKRRNGRVRVMVISLPSSLWKSLHLFTRRKADIVLFVSSLKNFMLKNQSLNLRPFHPEMRY